MSYGYAGGFPDGGGEGARGSGEAPRSFHRYDEDLGAMYFQANQAMKEVESFEDTAAVTRFLNATLAVLNYVPPTLKGEIPGIAEIRDAVEEELADEKELAERIEDPLKKVAALAHWENRVVFEAARTLLEEISAVLEAHSMFFIYEPTGVRLGEITRGRRNGS